MKDYNQFKSQKIASAENRFRNSNGRGHGRRVAQLDPNDRTLTFKITRVDTALASKVRLFGAALGTSEAYNTANNSLVTLKESSHEQIKLESLNSAFRVKSIKMKTDDQTQFDNPFSIVERSPSGKNSTSLWQPGNYESPYANNPKIIETEDFQMVITPNSAIEFDFDKGQEITIILKVTDKVAPGNQLYGRPEVESDNPYKSM